MRAHAVFIHAHVVCRFPRQRLGARKATKGGNSWAHAASHEEMAARFLEPYRAADQTLFASSNSWAHVAREETPELLELEFEEEEEDKEKLYWGVSEELSTYGDSLNHCKRSKQLTAEKPAASSSPFRGYNNLFMTVWQQSDEMITRV